VAVYGVGRETDELDAALGELGLELGEGAELGGTDGGVVLGVGEEDDPVVTDELVEVDRTGGGFGLEVGGDAAQAETEKAACALALTFPIFKPPSRMRHWVVRGGLRKLRDLRCRGNLRLSALFGHCVILLKIRRFELRLDQGLGRIKDRDSGITVGMNDMRKEKEREPGRRGAGGAVIYVLPQF